MFYKGFCPPPPLPEEDRQLSLCITGRKVRCALREEGKISSKMCPNDQEIKEGKTKTRLSLGRPPHVLHRLTSIHIRNQASLSFLSPVRCLYRLLRLREGVDLLPRPVRVGLLRVHLPGELQVLLPLLLQLFCCPRPMPVPTKRCRSERRQSYGGPVHDRHGGGSG